jgi:hypothetical protein
MGTGVLDRRRSDVGDELDYGIHPSLKGGEIF